MSSRNFVALAFDNSPRRQEGGVHNGDVLKRAIELGMDPSKDEKLFWIAEQSLKATSRIPDGWVKYVNEDGQEYYYNEVLDESTWEHPTTSHFQSLYEKTKNQMMNTPEREKTLKSTRMETTKEYRQEWNEQMLPPPPIPPVNDIVNELHFWRQKCEELELLYRGVDDQNGLMKEGLRDCEDKLRHVTSNAREFLKQHGLESFPPSDGEGGVVGAIKNSEEATRFCLSTIKSLLREREELKEKNNDALAESANWASRERNLKEDFRSMENKLLAAIDKKKSTIYLLEDDLGRLQGDVDRLRAERNDLRDVLDEQRAGDTSFSIVTQKLDTEYEKNKTLTRQLSIAQDGLMNAEIQVEELKGELSETVKKLRVARAEAEEALTKCSELSGENASVELSLLTAQKELRVLEEMFRGPAVSRDASLLGELETTQEQLQEEKRRRSGLEADLEKKCHELAVAQTKILGLQERIEDQKSTEQLLSSKLDSNSDRYLALQDKIEELMDKLGRSEISVRSVQKENEQLKTQLGDALDASCRTKNEHSRNRDHYDELMREKTALEETILCLEDDLRGSSDRYKSLQALFDKCVADLDMQQERMASLKSNVEEGKVAKEQLQEEKRRRSGLEADLEKKCHELAVAQTKILGLQERIEDQKSTEQLLSSRFSTLSKSLEDLRMSQEASKENEVSIKTSADLKVYELEVQRLSEQLSHERRRLADTEQSLAKAENRVEELASREALQSAHFLAQEKALQAKVEKKKIIIQDIAEQKRELEKNIAELYKELNTTLTDNETLRRQIVDAESSQAKADAGELLKVSAKLELERERSAALESHLAELRTSSTSHGGELRELRAENEEMKRKMLEAKSSVSRVQTDLDRERDICLALTNENKILEDEIKVLRKRIVKLNDMIVELKGSIMVFCRVRPVGRHEIEDLEVTQADIDRLVRYPDYNLIDFKQTAFEYDRVFTPASSQETIYDEVEPFVRSAMGGYRVCIFAYGQTSSGKTHTMEGPEHDRGVNLRALSTILQLSATDDAYATTVSMSMLEVYNEKIRDLLNLDEEVADLDVRMGKQGTYVDGLSEWPVSCMEDALATIGRGASNRMVASNHVNEHSSRSHLVTLIKIERRHAVSGDVVSGYLYLVDLAGSERIKQTAATGQRLKEAQNINKSLSSLGDVIAALASGQKHIPYRNSKLTFLLQDALRENSKVLMFVNVNPTPQYSGESLCSLQFASRCRSVQFGQAKKTVTNSSK